MEWSISKSFYVWYVQSKLASSPPEKKAAVLLFSSTLSSVWLYDRVKHRFCPHKSSFCLCLFLSVYHNGVTHWQTGTEAQKVEWHISGGAVNEVSPRCSNECADLTTLASHSCLASASGRAWQRAQSDTLQLFVATLIRASGCCCFTSRGGYGEGWGWSTVRSADSLLSSVCICGNALRRWVVRRGVCSLHMRSQGRLFSDPLIRHKHSDGTEKDGSFSERADCWQ